MSKTRFTKPTLVFTRPWHWMDYGSDKLNLVYVPIGGPVPKRKNGRNAGDGVGEVATPEGLQQLREAFKKYKPELFLYWVHFRFGLEEMERLKNISPDTRFLCGYGNQPHTISQHVKKFKKYIDTILLNSSDPRNYKKYLEFGIPHVGTLHDGFDPLEWVPIDQKRDYEVFFGGNQAIGNQHLPRERWQWKYPISEFRYDLLCAVHEKFNLHVRGNKRLPFKVHSYLWYPDYSPVFQQAHIILGCPHYDLVRYYSRRTIHGAGCGRLFITRYIPGMEDDFGSNHQNAVWFHTIEEALDQIKYYLDHPFEREKIAASCRELFVKNHSWEARLREMEKIAEDILE